MDILIYEQKRSGGFDWNLKGSTNHSLEDLHLFCIETTLDLLTNNCANNEFGKQNYENNPIKKDDPILNSIVDLAKKILEQRNNIIKFNNSINNISDETNFIP